MKKTIERKILLKKFELRNHYTNQQIKNSVGKKTKTFSMIELTKIFLNILQPLEHKI